MALQNHVMELVRVAYTDQGTFGVLNFDGEPFALTVERKWLNNQKEISCIPVGTYKAVRCRKSAEYAYSDSNKFGDTFVVEGVPSRSNILFHKGNIDDDSHGCVIVGEEFGTLNGELAVLASGKGFTEFKEKTIGAGIEEFIFEVKEAA